MEFINKVLELLAGIGKDACAKGKQLNKIVHLKSQIAACEEVIDKNYAEIGRLVYEQAVKTQNAGAYTKQCTAIANAKRGIIDLNARIEEAKKNELKI